MTGVQTCALPIFLIKKLGDLGKKQKNLSYMKMKLNNLKKIEGNLMACMNVLCALAAQLLVPVIGGMEKVI